MLIILPKRRFGADRSRVIRKHLLHLGVLETNLRRGRRRARGGLLLRGVLRGGLLAGTIFVVLTAVDQLLGPLTQAVWQWSAFALAAGLAVAVPWALLSTPSLIEMARRADLHFGLSERASTALEVAHQTSRTADRASAEVGAALFRDAERHAVRIEPRELVRLRLARELWLVLVLAVVAAAVLFGAPQLRAVGLGTPAAVATELGNEELGEVVTNLRRAAELLEQEAERRDDPYLEAVAEAMVELGESIELGEISLSEAQQGIERLLEHASRAYGLEELQIEEGDPLLTDAELTPESEGEMRSDDPEGREGILGASAAAANSEQSPLDQLLEQLEEDAAAREAIGNLEGSVTASYAAQIEEASERRALQRVRAEAAGGQPLGGAQESQAGESPFAGQGVQPLEGETTEPNLEGIDVGGEEVMLPGGEVQADEQVQMDLTPEADFTEVADTDLEGANAWETGEEAELRRDLLTPRDRAVVSRYFEQDEAEASSIN